MLLRLTEAVSPKVNASRLEVSLISIPQRLLHPRSPKGKGSSRRGCVLSMSSEGRVSVR